ncbi:MAG: helix-turn-helix transcriptional regulator [Endozoicomonadaceae bacterium]|nr:helix-turn-helix transcriptional regulator [Endozoicomonadaceae bacterium]MCY4329648.1 helix-turn-helix transcriptional regulator [Endozoicomonadaceae bacterium]
MHLTIRIIKARREKKLSQQALADLIGISRSALAQWETELSRPTLKSLRKMAEVLGVSFEWLATGRGNQYLTIAEDEIQDSELDSEINRLIPRLTVKRKKAVLEIIREMH